MASGENFFLAADNQRRRIKREKPMKVPRLFRWLVILLCGASVAWAEPESAIISRIHRQPVHSSNVASIGYSRHLRALEIEFTRGAIYRFLNVPRAIYDDLMVADSKGHYINTRLRGKYRFIRVRPPHKRRG